MQVEAAERRRQESENRGIKDPEKVRRMQERAAKLEKDELEAAKLGIGNPSLKVNNSVSKIQSESNIPKKSLCFISSLVASRLNSAKIILISTSDKSLLAL